MKRLWYRFLAWTFKRRQDAYLRVELEGSLDSRITHTMPFRDGVLVFTAYGTVYSVHYDPVYGRVGMRRVA